VGYPVPPAVVPTGVSPRKHIPGTCSGFSYCIDGKFHNGTCPEGQYFDKTIGLQLRHSEENLNVMVMLEMHIFLKKYDAYIVYRYRLLSQYGIMARKCTVCHYEFLTTFSFDHHKKNGRCSIYNQIARPTHDKEEQILKQMRPRLMESRLTLSNGQNYEVKVVQGNAPIRKNKRRRDGEPANANKRPRQKLMPNHQPHCHNNHHSNFHHRKSTDDEFYS
jgi:hypothetical protein